MGAVAAVYAQAALELADERGVRSVFVDDCRALAAALAEVPDLFIRLDDARVGRERLKATITAALSGKAGRELIDLACLVVDRNRLPALADICREVVVRAETEAGVVHVTATTAAPMTTGAESRLVDGLARTLGSGVILHTSIDSALIGGVTLRVGDTLFDASVRRQLAEMKALIQNVPARPDLWEGLPEGVSA